ncbi:MAG: hypothetical protein LBG62_06075 [Candidatus Methanoplasma sp.]|jgi:hypothetical protein|nr:hypothetical protein [Candidatus Methanoplasma sp.]
MSNMVYQTAYPEDSTQNLRGKDLENHILKKYLIGDCLDPADDRVIVNVLKSIGLLRCGFDLRENRETVRTTDRGAELLMLRRVISSEAELQRLRGIN